MCGVGGRGRTRRGQDARTHEIGHAHIGIRRVAQRRAQVRIGRDVGHGEGVG
jgi:hypothetical protein